MCGWHRAQLVDWWSLLHQLLLQSSLSLARLQFFSFIILLLWILYAHSLYAAYAAVAAIFSATVFTEQTPSSDCYCYCAALLLFLLSCVSCCYSFLSKTIMLRLMHFVVFAFCILHFMPIQKLARVRVCFGEKCIKRKISGFTSQF